MIFLDFWVQDRSGYDITENFQLLNLKDDNAKAYNIVYLSVQGFCLRQRRPVSISFIQKYTKIT